MVFSSIPFLYYFLPIVLILYYLAPGKGKNGVLLLASFVFYAWGEPKYILLMMVSILLGYLAGLLIEHYHGTKWAKCMLILSVAISVSFLGYFKYADFFITNFNAVTGLSVPLLKVALPIGISFYTFQLISYTIDVYRGSIKAQKSLLNLATYIAMFPQLIAGPIVRYTDIEQSLTTRTHTFTEIFYGIRRFILGLGKKVLLANPLGEFCTIFAASSEPSVLFYWMYAIAISLQIYFDFSGYSDMAIGLGRMFGFRFMENFNYPYISKSITEFWRRWHISLGSWFRDYIYIPMGGNRVSKPRFLLNIFTVWFLTGFWHGAAWNFILWGLYFAVLLMIEKIFLLKYLKQLPSIFAHIYVLLIAITSFVIFDASNIASAGDCLTAMFGFRNVPFVTAETIYYVQSYAVIFILAILGATPIIKQQAEKFNHTVFGSKITIIVEPIILLVLLLIATAFLVDGSFNPFLYFRF